MADHAGILDDEYRKAMDEHVQAIARLMYDKRLLHAGWRTEIDGTLFKFAINAYNKKGSPRDIEMQAEIL